MEQIQQQLTALNQKMDALYQSSSFPLEIEDAVYTRFEFARIPKITVAIAAPTVANVPSKAGDIYVDTVNSKIYIAKGNSAYTDYLILN
jgi:hypothetical protein